MWISLSYSSSGYTRETVICVRSKNTAFLHHELYVLQGVDMLTTQASLVSNKSIEFRCKSLWMNHQRLAYNVSCIGFRHIAILVKHNCIRNIRIVTFNLFFSITKKINLTKQCHFLHFVVLKTVPLQVCYWEGCCDESWNPNSGKIRIRTSL